MKRYQLTVIAALFAIIGCLVWAGSSKAATVIQSKTLQATGHTQAWTSTDKGSFVRVRVYNHGFEVVQNWINSCKASYLDPMFGLSVWVSIEDCKQPGQHPYIVRYKSAAGTQSFRVVLSVGS